MKRPSLHGGARMVAALAVSSGALTVGSLALTASSAHADPAWGSIGAPLVGVGSNTIEDLFDAYSGAAPSAGLSDPTNYYAPLHDPTTKTQVYSWDAVNPSSLLSDCISAKPGFGAMARPNGSGNAYTAMSDEVDGLAWSAGSIPGCPQVSINAEIDFGRSSSAPPTTTCANPYTTSNCLTYIDFAHDAVSYAFYGPAGIAANPGVAQDLTKANLQSIYNSPTGTAVVNGTTFIACLPQFGSGTEKFFEGAIGVSATNAQAAATAAKCVGFEENGANTFETTAAGAIPAGGVAVTPFSVGSFISQENGAAEDRTSTGVAAGVDLGAIDGTAGESPYSGTISGTGPQSLSPNPTFYASPTYGRDLYVIVDNKKINGSISNVSAVERRLFGFDGTNITTSTGALSNANTGSGAICAAGSLAKSGSAPATYSGGAQAYLSLFGFLPSSAPCGTETIVPVNSTNVGT